MASWRLVKNSPERRGSVRFPIVRDIRYQVLAMKKVAESGSGKTKNISSKGILFTTEHPLPVGSRIQVWINWPMRLDNRCAINLVVLGSVVRYDQGMAAVQVDHCEFRTRGSTDLTPSSHQNPPRQG